MDHIFQLTGCRKPCHYSVYRHVRPLVPTLQLYGTQCLVTIWNASPNTSIMSEVLVYPWTSLVAEFGGTLSLFLGFSMMTIWDGLQTMKRLATKLKEAWENKDMNIINIIYCKVF